MVSLGNPAYPNAVRIPGVSLLPAPQMLAPVQCLVLCEELSSLSNEAHCASLMRASTQDI